MSRTSEAGATRIDELPPMLTAKQCAELGGWSRKHVTNCLNNGTLKGTKLGRSWRINRDYYLAFLGMEA